MEAALVSVNPRGLREPSLKIEGSWSSEPVSETFEAGANMGSGPIGNLMGSGKDDKDVLVDASGEAPADVVGDVGVLLLLP